MSGTAVLARNRTPLLLGGLVVLVLVLAAWLRADSAEFGGPLDPRNPHDIGAQAVARVLADHDVDVQVARGQQSFLARGVDDATTVVVSNADTLGPSTMRRLREHGRTAGTVVLVGSSPTVLAAFGLAPAGIPGADLAAGCTDPVVRDLTVRVPDSLALAGAGCFGRGGASLLQRPVADPRVWVMTAPEVLSNAHVLEADNAAVALRLLGQHPHLVWYVADAADTTATDAVSVSTLLPRWLFPGLWLLALSTLAFLVWRARRLGPLVREPLPVVVRAAESTESRGRLYRRTRDRGHAALMLRAATRRRLTDQLALSGDDPTALLVAAVAGATGREAPEVAALLDDSPVRNDAALADLGRRLLHLEAEVRHR